MPHAHSANLRPDPLDPLDPLDPRNLLRSDYTATPSPDLAFPQNFDWTKLIYSDTASQRGINNHPPAALWPNLHHLAWCLAEIESYLAHPLQLNSVYRCPALNACVGGVPHSQHVQGLAADFVCKGFGTPYQVAAALANSALVFDQLILEFGRWVHVSVAAPGDTPRRMILTLRQQQEGYLEGLFE